MVIDSWGQAIVLQVKADGTARLVSAGFDKALDTKIINNRGGDDRILYLNASTPVADINPSCD